MKRHLKFIFLAPLLLAALCDPFDDFCTVEDPEKYTLNIENNASSYGSGETIWLQARTSSMLINYCSETEGAELINDPEIFLGGLFLLKLNDSSEFNAQIFNDANVIYDVGEMYSFNACSNSINVLPALSADSVFYRFRIGITVDEPGDYCIVNAINNNFNISNENNDSIFQPYNNFDDQIHFNNCGDTYIRTGTEGHYFFTIQ